MSIHSAIVNDAGTLLLACSAVAGNVLLIERRNRKSPINPQRHIEIRTLLDSMPESVIIVDPTAIIVDANSATERLSGFDRDHLLGMKISEFSKCMEGSEGSNVTTFRKSIMARALEGEHVEQERHEYVHPKTGEPIDLLISANPIRNESGEIQGALMVSRDITEIGRLQQRLADISRHQAIGHVAAGIAHDFNNTLQTISQAVAVLHMSASRPPEERKVFLNMIDNAVRRGAEVIARIRDYLSSSKSVLDDVDVCALLQDSVELTRPMWQRAGIEVKTNLGPTPRVCGNAADLRRVFTNLIINSVQAMPNGGSLTLGCEEVEPGVHAWVRDTGQGIKPEARKLIFNPYFTTKAGGTGLGLSGAQKILLDLGGNISFSSEPNEGTQFDLYLPRIAEAS